jgi:hypothetical protein
MYVKIFDEEAFNLFWMVMKEVLETIGRGKAISRGYGKLHQVKVVELNEEEQSVFAYLNTLKQQGILVVLNNFKPSEQEIKMIDLEHSFLSFTNKNTKSLGKHIFKGNMTFIAPGSVLQKKANTPDFVGSYYQVNQSFNF